MHSHDSRTILSSECEPLNLICFELDLRNVAGNLSCDLLHGSVFVKPVADHSIIGLQCLCSVLRFAVSQVQQVMSAALLNKFDSR